MAEQQKAPGSSDEVAQNTRKRRKDGSVWVKATRVGYMNFERKREGSRFQIRPEEYGTGWMVALTGPDGDEDPELSEQLTAGVDAARIEQAVAKAERAEVLRARMNPTDAGKLRAELTAEAAKARAAAGHGKKDGPALDEKGRATNDGQLQRGGLAHPDTGSAPSSGEGTNLNPGTFTLDKDRNKVLAKDRANNKDVA